MEKAMAESLDLEILLSSTYGKYYPNNPLVFLLMPQSHRLWESENKPLANLN